MTREEATNLLKEVLDSLDADTEEEQAVVLKAVEALKVLSGKARTAETTPCPECRCWHPGGTCWVTFEDRK